MINLNVISIFQDCLSIIIAIIFKLSSKIIFYLIFYLIFYFTFLFDLFFIRKRNIKKLTVEYKKTLDAIKMDDPRFFVKQIEDFVNSSEDSDHLMNF